MQVLSRVMFGFAGSVLMLLAAGLIVFGCWRLFSALTTPDGNVEEALLSAVGYVVISIAVFDVAKFLIEEEVLNGRERRIASEARRSLTNFISTIAIAVFLEALVTVFRVSSTQISQLLYPTALLVAGSVLVLGLGVYQRLSVTVEKEVDSSDRSEEARH
jgi:putative Mn2+ efflux pump MntP